MFQGRMVPPKNCRLQKLFLYIKKVHEKLNPSNHRPVAILSSFGKIIEKLFAMRLSGYLTKFSLLTECQYDFRPK